MCYSLISASVCNSRSAIEEEREINHHGKSIKVGHEDGIDEDNFLPTNNYDKNLVSRDERTQDNALKKVFIK